MQAGSLAQVALERGKSLAIPGWWRHLGSPPRQAQGRWFPSTTGKRPVGVVLHDRQKAGGGSSQDVWGPTSGQVEDDHVNGGS